MFTIVLSDTAAASPKLTLECLASGANMITASGAQVRHDLGQDGGGGPRTGLEEGDVLQGGVPDVFKHLAAQGEGELVEKLPLVRK